MWGEAGLKEVISLQVSSSDNWRKSLASHGIKSTIHIENRISVARVFSLVKEEQASLVVVDTHRPLRQRNTFLRNLINNTPVPILITNGMTSPSSSTDKYGVFETVVLALDFSPAYDKALTFLFTFKALIKALEIVNVINSKLTIRDIRDLKNKLRQSRRLFTDNGIDAESHVYAGKTAEQLITSARDYRATLVVLGISGKLTLFKRLSRRSTAYAVAEQARVPVLFVP